ncbi:hypothetical protein GCM10010431_86400 [Streptomyces kunmingensis]
MVGEVGQRRALPEGQGLAQDAGRCCRVVRGQGRGALADQALEDVQVDVGAGRCEAVAAGLRGDRFLAQGSAQAAYQGLEGGWGVGGWGVGPYVVDEGVDGGRSRGVRGQGREQGAEAGAAYGYGGALSSWACVVPRIVYCTGALSLVLALGSCGLGGAGLVYLLGRFGLHACCPP